MTVTSETDPGDLQAFMVAASGDTRARQQAALLAFGRRTTNPPAYGVLLHDAITFLIDACEVQYGLFAELAADQKKFVARTEVRESGIPSGSIEIPDVGSQSLADFTLETGRPCVVQDLATDQRFKDLPLRRLGIVSAAAVPLQHFDNRFGVVVLGTTRPKKMTGDDLAFFETVCHLLASAIAREKVDQILKEERLLRESLCDALPNLVLLVDDEGTILQVNRACQDISSFSADDLTGRQLWNALAAPECAVALQSWFHEMLAADEVVPRESSLLTKRGTRTPVLWSHTALNAGRILLIGTVADPSSAAKGAAPKAAAQLPSSAAANGAGNQATGSDRRTSVRRTFRFQQRVAPYYGTMPADSEYFVARFSDISAGGVSFILDAKPPYKAVVIELGTAPRISRIRCDVVRVVPIDDDGRQRCLIGCRFVERF